MKKLLLCLLCVMFLSSSLSFAQDNNAAQSELADLKQQLKQMQQQMNTMVNRIQELEGQKQVQQKNSSKEVEMLQARVDELEKQEKQSDSSLLSTLNPQVSVIGDFTYTNDENGGEGDNDFNMREVELAFSANVDTWAKGDVILAVENEDGSTEVGLEEGYLTLLETPIENLQVKLGKFRPYLGKVNKMHLHTLPWTNYPLVIQNFLGEEGFAENGVSLSYLLPFDHYSEFTVEAFNNGTTVLGGGEESEVVYLGHWKNFFDLGDVSTLELGGTYSWGENGAGNGADTRLYGFDVTLNSELFDDRRTTSHTEFLFNDREQAVGSGDINSWGMFTSLEQQIADRWWAFGRYDFTQTPTASNVDTNAYSAGLTFAQSEYVFWRAMYTHTDNETGDDDNTVWLQMDFSIGPHKPHSYR